MNKTQLVSFFVYRRQSRTVLEWYITECMCTHFLQCIRKLTRNYEINYIDKFSRPCYELTSVWSMFPYTVHVCLLIKRLLAVGLFFLNSPLDPPMPLAMFEHRLRSRLNYRGPSRYFNTYLFSVLTIFKCKHRDGLYLFGPNHSTRCVRCTDTIVVVRSVLSGSVESSSSK